MNAMSNLNQMFNAFVVLFAVIDVIGSLPLFISLESTGRAINPKKAAIYSFLVLLAFFLAGDRLLRLFSVDDSSFAVAGSFVLFILAMEMILNVEFFKNNGAPKGSSTLVPVVFPLIAGPGTLTTLLSIRAEYTWFNIIVALFFNMVIVYLALRYLGQVRRALGDGAVFVLRKVFGIILMAIAVRLFSANIHTLFTSFN